MATPMPKLGIVLDDESKLIYYAGNKVSGIVVLNGPGNLGFRDVRIELRGRSKSKYRETDKWNEIPMHGRGSLFSTSLTLYDSHANPENPAERQKQPVVQQWPFEFVIPSTAMLARPEDQWGTKWPEGNKYFKGSEEFKETSLPSSWLYSDKSLQGIDCYVKYELEATARLNTPKRFGTHLHHVFTDSLILPFAQTSEALLDPKSNQLNRTSQLFSVKIPVPGPNYQGQKLGPFKQVKSVFKRESVQNAQLLITWHTPQAIKFNEPLSFRLEGKIEQKSAEVVQPPSFAVFDMHMEIVYTTHVRCVEDKYYTRIKTGLSKRQLPLRRLPDSDEPANATTFREATLPLQLRAEPIRPSRLVPSFATFNICREYQLNLKCRVKCPGNEFNLKLTAPLKVVPLLSSEVDGAHVGAVIPLNLESNLRLQSIRDVQRPIQSLGMH